MANLTDRNFWANYWKNHAYQKVGNEVFYSPLIRTQNGESKKFIELGGFPGYGCVYFKKELGYEVSIFDFYIDKTIVNKVEEVNGLPIGTIECIEGDLFAYTAKSEYDFVISLGLIEHFDDTKDIIARHLSFMKEDGELLIMLPNFRGLNGWVQRTFDPENYKVHNIKSMDVNLISNIAKELGLKETNAFYYGKPMVWLEAKHGAMNAIIRKFIKLVNLVLRVLPFGGRLFSPYIALQAKK